MLLGEPTNEPPMVVSPPALDRLLKVGALTAPLPSTIPGPWSPNIELKRIVLPAPAVAVTSTPLPAS